MSLYVPRDFASGEFEAAQALIEAHPFATLVTAVDGEAPQIAHLPMMLEGKYLTGHLARANPQWKNFAVGRTVAVFHGPHAYISPTGYEHPAEHVPTWNYATVHIEGRPELLDEDTVAALIEQLTEHFDAAGFRNDPHVLKTKLPGIVAFRMPIERWTAKFKMSQNRTAKDRAGVVANLRVSGNADDADVARWMQDHEAR